MPEDMKTVELLPLVTEVVAAKLSNGRTPSSDIAVLIQGVRWSRLVGQVGSGFKVYSGC